jgi:CHAD domain-containing protein
LQREARERLLVALSSARYEELVGGLTLALEKADSGALDFDTPVGDFVLPTLRKKYRRLRRISKTLALDSEAAAYHEARKRGKKLRYATEFFADILGKPATRLVEATKQVQDLLGEHQDASVTVGWLRESVATRGHIYPPGTLLRMGELLEKQNVKMVELRRQCPSAFDKLRGGWKALRKSVRRNSSDASSADRSEKAALPLRRHMWPLHRLFARRGPRPH